ncbi:hypothetical protein CYMTET_56848 [Cymbomonas tetramitiformis]|uniref:Uncharacterized protein n=1 Tax=Cymbomonas tetramitiformis TaxID=36881 RepID=A0AAE0ELW5_9CHLO|nr:hypothetical protein CYMTET_56848 [Cymbomonas tetramitiformis]
MRGHGLATPSHFTSRNPDLISTMRRLGLLLELQNIERPASCQLRAERRASLALVEPAGGNRLQEFWRNADARYPGTVGAISDEGKTKLLYDGGDVEWLNLSEKKTNAQSPRRGPRRRQRIVLDADGGPRDSAPAGRVGTWQPGINEEASDCQEKMQTDSCASTRACEETVHLYGTCPLVKGAVQAASMQPYLSTSNNYNEDTGFAGLANRRGVNQALKGAGSAAHGCGGGGWQDGYRGDPLAAGAAHVNGAQFGAGAAAGV